MMSAPAGAERLRALSGDSQIRLAERVEAENQKFAGLQEALVQAIAAELLERERAAGSQKYGEALRRLEEARGTVRHVSLPAEPFSGAGSQLVFPVSEQSGTISVPVQGLLLDCVVSYIKRTASGIRPAGRELMTEQVAARIRAGR